MSIIYSIVTIFQYSILIVKKEFIIGGLFFSMIQFINSNKDSSSVSNKKIIDAAFGLKIM